MFRRAKHDHGQLLFSESTSQSHELQEVGSSGVFEAPDSALYPRDRGDSVVPKVPSPKLPLLSSNLEEQGNSGTRNSRRRFQSLFVKLYHALQARKRRSRFYGWQWGVFIGSLAGIVVLVLNIVFVIIGASVGSDYQDGIVTLFTGSAAAVSRGSTLLHVLINALSTSLLSASNYTMQVLSAPTRSECKHAHQQGRWLEVGVPSVRNIRYISRHRKVVWSILALSSVPLHLLYNASVFQVITGNDYAVRVVANNSLELDRFGPNNKEFSNISVSELKKIYESEYVSGYGDMTLAISAARLEFL